MITAIDTSVLFRIYKGEPDAEAWVGLLADLAENGRTVICDVVVAEMAGAFQTPEELFGFLQTLKIEYDGVRIETAALAGRIFLAYRQAGGPQEHLIPDFLIGAHAICQAGQIAAADRGYLRRHFPRLKVIAPR